MTIPNTNRRTIVTAAAAAAVTGACAGPGGGLTGAEDAGKPEPRAGADTAAFPVGLTGYMFKHYTLDEIVAMATRLAVTHVAVKPFHLPDPGAAGPFTAALKKIEAAGLALYCAGVIYMKNAEDVEKAFAFARAAKIELFSASLHPRLLPVADAAARKRDIRMAIHNHGPEDKHYPTPRAIHEKIADLDRRIGICHDTGHTIRAGRDPVAETLKTADRTMDCHLKDVDAATAKGHSVELGRGVMDIPAFAGALSRIGYRGVLGVEYEKHMKDLLPGLAESVGYTRGVLDTRAGA